MSQDQIFNPAVDGGDHQTAIADAIACTDAFTDCFNARNLEGMDAQLHFPHLILSGERLIVWDAPGQLSLPFFDELAGGGWHHTQYHARDPVLVSPRKIHLLVDYSRNRHDGAIISRHRNVWIVTCESGRWGIKLRSY